MLRSHKIALQPNHKQATYFAKACGVARFACNWTLAEWKRRYETGERPTEASLRRQLKSDPSIRRGRFLSLKLFFLPSVYRVRYVQKKLNK